MTIRKEQVQEEVVIKGFVKGPGPTETYWWRRLKNGKCFLHSIIFNLHPTYFFNFQKCP